MENRWEKGAARQRIVAGLGRLDRLRESGQLEVLLRSLGRCAEGVEVQSAQERGELSARHVRSVGPALVVEKVWRDLGIDQMLEEVAEGRKHGFNVERAVLASVVPRLFETGSDRQAVGSCGTWLCRGPTSPSSTTYRTMRPPGGREEPD